MSVKGKRFVTFKEPVTSLYVSEPNNNINSYSFHKTEGLPRSRSRSRSWSRFRSRWNKSCHDLNNDTSVCLQRRDSSHESAGLARAHTHSSVRSLVKLFEVLSMSEGRKSQIILLDDRRLDIMIQPKLFSSELLDLVASHFKLKEKQYFGLGFLDDSNHFNWLQGEKRVLDHEFPKKAGLLVLYFAIKFFVDSIVLLRDIQTVELFYFSARQNLFRGQLLCDSDTVFELAAYVLQATFGDFISEELTREQLKKLPVIPTSTLKEHPSISYCEERIISYYEKINGTSRGLAIVNYMNIVEKLSTYGIHYYDVKDKKDIPWCLGVSPKGIAVYDRTDKNTHRKLFHWKKLENLYYKDKKFSIEVHNPKRISTNNRSAGAVNVDVHTWFACSQQLIKCIWSMSVVQHQFYLDNKHSQIQLPAARSMSEIAAGLCESTTSLPGSLGSDISRSTSSHSLTSLSNSRYDLTVEQSDSLKAEREMYQALKARKEALEECLREKTAQLKLLCLQEGELLGKLPLDTPLSPGEQPPVFRRRVGTAFSLSVKNVQNGDQLSSELSKLELEVELQGNITAAAHRLANDKTVSKYVRKQRKQSYTRAIGKLKDMEKKLDDMRKAMRKSSSSSNPNHQSGRSFDGMYRVQHLHPKHDLDTDHVSSIVHEQSSLLHDESCGNSINSGNLSLGSKDASSGYYSASTTSIYSSTQQNPGDDLSSYCGSESLSTVKNFRDDDDGDSRVVGDSEGGDFVLGIVDDQCSTLTHPGKRKHFVISRGQHNTRVKELDDGLSISKSSTSMECDSRETSHLATSESALDLDSTIEDSFNRSSVFDACEEEDLRDEESKSNTRVERRGQTFIASRGLMKSYHSDGKHAGFEKGWKTFQDILMGEDDKSRRKVAHKEYVNGSLVGPGGISSEKKGAQRSRGKNDEERQKKIQELINNNEGPTQLVRTRSFDYTHGTRIKSENSFIINKTDDDMKLVRSRSKLKTSATNLKNPFNFFAQKITKNKQTRHSPSGSQISAVYSCIETKPASNEDSHPRKNLLQTCVPRSNAGHETRKTPANCDSKVKEVLDLHCDTKHNSGLKSRTQQAADSNCHYPRSSSVAAMSHSRRGSDINDRLHDQADITEPSRGQCNTDITAHMENIDSSKDSMLHTQHHHHHGRRRRSSWHSNSSRSVSLSTSGTETTV